MACNGYITLKVLELIISIVCIIYKRVTDLEASQLYYFLQNRSREWALINNIFWDENGAIFADMTYGGFVIISAALIIGQAKGELQNARYTENFLLVMGALMYFGAAALELAAIDSVPPGLVDNAAILGVVSLVGGLIFIIDVLLAGKRRKIPPKKIRTLGYEKQTQTEGTMKSEIMTNGGVTDNMGKKIPTNGVKLLPTSPAYLEEPSAPNAYPVIPITNSNNEFVGTISPPLYTPQELKNPNVKIKSTESFLRSEKGEMPVIRRTPSPEEIMIPQGYILVPAKSIERLDTPTPPGYASIDPKFAMMAPRKLQSPTVSTTIKTPQGYYYTAASRDPSPTEDDIPQQSFTPQKDRAWPLGPKPKSYDDSDSPFRRSSPFRSSKQNMMEPRGRLDKGELSLPSNLEDTSLDGHKIEEELRRIRNITKSDADLTAEIAKENQALKHILRKEKEEKIKLKNELQKSELEERKRLEERINELEEYQSMLEKELKIEERKKLEKKIRELEDEKDRRMSEKEVQYFGVHDLQKSKKESSPIIQPKLSNIEEYFRESPIDATKGVKDINSKLKEKNAERRKDDEELRKVIEEGFHFLDDEERKKRSGKLMRDLEERRSLYEKRKDFAKMSESKGEDWRDDEIPSREDTPGGASYKSEAQLWLGGKEPISPKDPGYVLHTAHNWPESTSVSPTDRFRFSSRKANQSFKTESSSPSPDYPDKHSSGEEPEERVQGRRRGLLLRKVDFPDDPVTIEVQRPATAAGNTSSWKRWLQPATKTKLHASRSTPQ